MLVAALAATLSHAAVRRSGTNDVIAKGVVDTLRPGHRVCQTERIPDGTAAIEVGAAPSQSPLGALRAQVLDISTLAPIASGVTVGERPDTATLVPLHPVVDRERVVRVCLALRTPARGATALLFGLPIESQQPSATDGERSLDGVVRLDYLRAGRASWWSFAPTIVERLGRGRAWFGSAVAPIAALLVLISISAAAWLLVRES